MIQELLDKKKKIAVIGLGYVGLPIALEFARKYAVIGFDIHAGRIDMLKNKIDPSNELGPEEFDGTDILFTHSIDDLRQANFYIVAVPTPIDEHNIPDLKPLLAASRTIGQVLKKGDYAIFESTVYPGCTEEDCLPILEQLSGLQLNKDFYIGYSPERINPGDKEHTLTKIKKVVSGSTPEALDVIAKVYGAIITAGIHQASSIKVAEAAKIIENTQRDINIALMNELSLIFNLMGINTYDVLEAAGTKWNFLKFYPGLVGGHCIGVDPYYLTHKAQEIGYHSKVILSGRQINDSMGAHVAQEIIRHMTNLEKPLKKTQVLIMGATFKENVTDIRNSKVVDIYRELRKFLVNVDVIDPLASSEEVAHEYGFNLLPAPDKKYDAIVLAVSHEQYVNLDEGFFRNISVEDGLVVDIKGILRNRIRQLRYWSL
jgi:UDP-N-acetyl-D-glucosamine/UDP-N-acetyl-D-galactosamine dehydrogenase